MEMKKEGNFSEWYHEVLEEAEVVDARYNMKGALVWRPFGFQLRKLVFGYLGNLMEATGHQETLFPLMIPEGQLMKEAEHLEGFSPEVYWVTKGGDTELEVPLAIRPTSETAMYPMFALWIRSHADLPLKIFQTVNIFRYETKHTRPLIRDREVSTFKEAHCAHATQDSVDEEMAIIRQAYNSFMDALCLPYIVSRRPSWDKFPGANVTYSYDQVMPDNKTLQVATTHDLGQGFAKMYDVHYEDESGEQQLCHMSSHGISSRIIAGLVGAHGDDKGLVLPPIFAPTQIVIVPIVFKGNHEPEAKALELAESLSTEYRVECDTRDRSPGDKFYHWELRGVPIRLELGPKDMEKSAVMMVRRDTGEKKSVPLDSLKQVLEETMLAIEHDMRKRAWGRQNKAIVTVQSVDEVLDAEKKGLVVKAPLCCEGCGKALEDKLSSYEVRGFIVGEKPEGKCVECGKPATEMGLLSNAY